MADTITSAGLRRFIKQFPVLYRPAARIRQQLTKVVGRRKGPTKFRQSIAHVAESLPEKGDLLLSAIDEYCAAHGEPADPIRVVHLFHQVQAANKLSPGDYIELGVHKGLALRAIHRFMDPSRTLYALDTFEGFDERDIAVEKRIYRNNWHAGNFSPTSVEGVGLYVGSGQSTANLKLIKGWFPESFHGLEDRRWRFVHIDFDLYQPIKIALETLWDAVLPGGIVMVHDYGCYGFPGARQAVDEFCQRIGIFPIELGDRWGTAALRKPAGDRR